MATTQNPIERIKMLYFTNPVCFHRWAFEGTMNHIKHEYDAVLDIDPVTGRRVDEPLSES